MLNLLYAAIARRRRRNARPRHRLSAPVVSIGNIAAGGRAKTPMAEVAARALLHAGERPSILSRGYGRERARDNVVIVRDAQAVRGSLAGSGDEPLMLAERLDGAIVAVHPDRGRAGAVAEELGATVHVLDDGFQHLQLARDIDIVMVHVRDLDDRVIPAGRLREPIDALAHASAIVLIDASDSEAGAAIARIAALSPGRIFRAARRVVPPPPDVARQRGFFVSGIADAAQALKAVRDAGWEIAGDRSFGDHHRYTAADAERIARECTSAGAAFAVTTGKDAVRLRQVWTSPLPLHVAGLDLAIPRPEEFDAWLVEALRLARDARLSAERRLREDGPRRAS